MRRTQSRSREHEHRWEPVDGCYPIFEDLAAIFHEACRWQPTKVAGHSERLDETFYEPVGPECDAERHVRFDASYIWYPNGQGAPVPEPGEELPERMEEGLIEVEQAAATDDAELVDVDPDPDHGEVRAKYDGWTVVYKP